jgi:hypothetical protein
MIIYDFSIKRFKISDLQYKVKKLMENICKFCHHRFSSKHNLKFHQKTARYCLKLRDIEGPHHQCNDCEKNFSSKHNLKIHKKSCQILDFKQKFESLERQVTSYQITIKGLENQLESQKTEIEGLQDKLQEAFLKAIDKPTTTNKIQHQIVQNLVQITPEHLEKSAENLTINHIEKGVDGYKKFLLDYPLKNSYYTNDYSRRIISFVDEDGKIVVDPNMTELLQRIFKAIMSKNTELINKRIGEIVEYANQNPDNLCTELLALQWDKQRDMLLNKELVDEVGNGSVNGLRQNIAETYQALIRGLCKHGMCSKELQQNV